MYVGSSSSVSGSCLKLGNGNAARSSSGGGGGGAFGQIECDSSDEPPEPTTTSSSSSSTATLLPSSPSASPPLTKSLTLWGFCMISFFLVCGGPFGLEATIMAGGPLLTLIGFVCMPIIWSLPQALMTAEMSCLIPDNGGYVLWCKIAFGDLAGWLAALNGTVSSLFDLALYPSLAVSYIKIVVELDLSTQMAIKIGIVIACVLVNIWGLRYVGAFSAIITILVTLPFVISAFVQYDKIIDGGPAFTQIPSQIDWGVFLSTLLWSFTGWDSLGCLAGEVANPSYTYTRGSLLTLLLVVCTYSLPTIVSIQTHPDLSQWKDGSFSEFAYDVSSWMGSFTVIACVAANIGMFVAGLSASARAMSAMATPYDTPIIVTSGNNSDKSTARSPRIAHLPSLFAFTYNSSPLVALIAHALVISILFPFDFEELVQADMVLTCVRLVFEFGSFLKFRLSHSDWHREFIVPGGWWGAALITIPKLLVILCILISCDRFTWTLAACVNISGCGIWLLRRALNHGDSLLMSSPLNASFDEPKPLCVKVEPCSCGDNLHAYGTFTLAPNCLVKGALDEKR